MIRVLHVYRTYFPETQGGLEEAIRQMCLASQSHGIESKVLTLAKVDRTKELHFNEAIVIQVPLQIEPASCSMGFGLFKEYRRQAEWADVIHLHYPWPFVDVVHLLSGVRKPVLMTYHSDIIRQRMLNRLYSPLRSLLFKATDHVVTTSPNYLRTSETLQRLRKPTSVIPLALNENSYAPPTHQALTQVDREYGRDFFLFVGVLRYYKGLHHLIEAAAIAKLPVVIAGKGPEMSRLQGLIDEYGASSVRLIGYVDDDMKQALYKNCRAVVFPSCERSEAFGMTLLEGMMNKRPLISCEIGTGTSFVNQHNETGVVVPPSDPQALASAMQMLLEDNELASRYGDAAYNRFKKHFSSDSMGASYAERYKALATNNATGMELNQD